MRNKAITFSINEGEKWSCDHKDCLSINLEDEDHIYFHMAYNHQKNISWVEENKFEISDLFNGNNAKNGICIICGDNNYSQLKDLYAHIGREHSYIDLAYNIVIKNRKGDVRKFYKKTKFKHPINNAGEIIDSNLDIICRGIGTKYYPEDEVRILSNATDRNKKCCDGAFEYPHDTIIALYEDKGKNHIRNALKQIVKTKERLQEMDYKIPFAIIYVEKLSKSEKKMWAINDDTFELYPYGSKNKTPLKIGSTRIYIFQLRYRLRRFWFNLSKSKLSISQGFKAIDHFK